MARCSPPAPKGANGQGQATVPTRPYGESMPVKAIILFGMLTNTGPYGESVPVKGLCMGWGNVD